MGTTEALKLLVQMQYAYRNMELTEYADALMAAIKAIDNELFFEELTTAKNPLRCIINIDGEDKTLAYCCPNCYQANLKQDYRFCPTCGQRLDWRDN